MLILFVLFLLVSFVAICVFLSVWDVHKSMTRGACKTWNYGTFNEFMKVFNGIEWERDSSHPDSFFGKGTAMTSSHIHAPIVKLNGHGFVFYPWSYIRFLKFIKDNRVQESRRDKNLWR